MSDFWISVISGLKMFAISLIAYAAAMQATGLDPFKEWKQLLIGALVAAFLKGGEKVIQVKRAK